MDHDLFLQQLRDLSLEEGKAYIQAHASEISDHAALGVLLAKEARRLLYTPLISLKLAELLIFFGEYYAHASSHALGLKAKGDALVQIGHHQAAMDCLDTAKEEFLLLGDESNAARTRISWILACAWLGNVEEALQEAARARDVFLKLGELYWVCVINNNTALIYDQAGRYKEALDLYENMQAIYPTLAEQRETSTRRSIALAEMNHAVHLTWFGNFERAYHLQQQARARFIELGEINLINYSEANLAAFDYAQGYYGSALRRYYQAFDNLTQNNIDNPMLLADLKLCMGNCLMKLNRAHEASQLAAEVVEVERQFGISLNTVFALREYVTTLLASDRLKETLAVLDEALRICKERGLDHQATTIQLQQAELLLKVGAFSEAYSSTRLLREYFEAQGLVSYAARASLVMVGALIERVQQAGIDQAKEERAILLEEATSLCKQVAWQARHYNLQEEVYKSHYLLGRLWDLQENSTKATRHYSAAIAQIERILDDLVYDLSPSFLRAAWTVYEDVIAHCLQERQTERAFNYLEQARSMALRQYLNKSSGGEEPKEEQKVSQTNSIIMLRMQRELKDWQETHRDYSLLLSEADSSVSPTVDKEVIKAELNRCEAKLSELFERLSLYQGENALGPRAKKHGKQRAKQVDIVQLRQQLTPDQLLLVYFLYKGKLVIFAVTQAGVTYHEIPNGVEQLERLLPLLHAHLQPGGWPDIQQPPQQAIRRLLNKLHHLLIAPVANLLPPHAGSLTIVPYGPLHKLPFHALYDGRRFLVENFQVNYLPASSILVHLRNRSGQQAHQPTEGSLTGKQPLVFGYSGNGHVQCTLDEAKTLADLLNGRSYLEGEATIARLIEQAPGSPIIHIATHGHSRLDAPNFSYVLLADGQLNALDAFSLDLRECELVTLSGCETGLALTGGGDEQLGLGRAFLAAGAKALVMSLWPVEDTATSELMQLFYKQLLNGESKVQALRAAQCQLLHHSTSNYTHPYFWAAFRLVGDVSPLGLKGQDLVLPASKVGR